MLYSLFLAFQLFQYSIQETETTGTITVEVSEFKNTDGHLLISLFNSAEHFPDNAEESFKNKKVEVDQNKLEVVFENVPFGEYALVFLHDENENGEMDTNFVGAPKEGYGASNDAVNTFSAPKYSDAKFNLNSKTKEISLKVFY
ncbi:DUF2141 domain-containing protein [Marivirga sp. S37H4]|uniref:DUF2141 domain-containing protein n=1 Tax=Marivirga aurantiaca TaxID=2802615 RepID=A0A934WX49_9BACT|nr:DUF2141 domain-containing protein [Marivirga aurantiaca]MBK6264546.1 DUF2141 domain-containing protein [Marivirga aurantiaca]